MKMTKRFGTFLLTIALLLALAGCGAAPSAQPAPAPAQGEMTAPNAAPSASAPSEAERRETGKDAEAAESGAPQNDAPAPSGGEDPSGAENGGGASDAPTECAAPSCTVSVSCAAILENLDRLDAEKTDLVPADGVLLAPTAAEFTAGESAFDLLKRVCRENKIHMEFSETPLYQSAYVEGIGNLYEFDCGEGSGWMYRVNGEFPNVGCSRYALADGDTVEWVYTCDFGADVGGRVGT